ncbi:MAG TPA: nitroreductase/quinone reductase family protein, partial [Candidatus Limnocylindria bacterium]|nr:nitroreductase/quinone reductase family protein [Candidatus Limnocylindria bacterium]
SPASVLAALKDRRNVQLTTTGRRSGKPHTVPVWFVVEDDRIYLNTLDPTRDWVRNAKKTPEVRLDFGDTVLIGRFRTVTDPALAARITEALREKYWIAWAGGLIGQGPKETYVVDELRPATP